MITFGLLFLVPADPVRMIAGRSALRKPSNRSVVSSAWTSRSRCSTCATSATWSRATSARSYVQKAEVSELVASRVPATLQLMAAAIFFELLLGLPAGAFDQPAQPRSTRWSWC